MQKKERDEKMKEFYCTIIGMIGAAITTFFGGWDTGLATLITFMAIDYITGFIARHIGWTMQHGRESFGTN